MTFTTCELIWLKHLLQELHSCRIGNVKLIHDNQVALHTASNTTIHGRTKYIEINSNFIREKIMSRKIATSFVGSNFHEFFKDRG